MKNISSLIICMIILITGCYQDPKDSAEYKELQTKYDSVTAIAKVPVLSGFYQKQNATYDKVGLDFTGTKVTMVGNNVTADYKIEGKYLFLENVPLYGGIRFSIVNENTLLKEDGAFEGTYIKK